MMIVPDDQGTIWTKWKSRKYKNWRSKSSIQALRDFPSTRVRKATIKRILFRPSLFCAPRRKGYSWINKDLILISHEYENFTIFINRNYDIIWILFDHFRAQRAYFGRFGILEAIFLLISRFYEFFVKSYDDVIRTGNCHNRDQWPSFSQMTKFDRVKPKFKMPMVSLKWFRIISHIVGSKDVLKCGMTVCIFS